MNLVEIKEEDDDNSNTLSDGLFVLADIVYSGGDFPVERATQIKEKEKQ